MSYIILINGPSSAGKSTLARALHATIELPFLHFSFDLFIDSDVLPRQGQGEIRFDWKIMRPQVMAGYYHCLEALARQGNNLIVDHIFETAADVNTLIGLFQPFDVFLVGVHCPLAVLERREVARGNRRIGEAAHDLSYVHSFTPYDLTIACETPLEDKVTTLLTAWRRRRSPSVFARLATNGIE